MRPPLQARFEETVYEPSSFALKVSGWLVFRKHLVRILAGARGILTKIFHGVPESYRWITWYLEI